MADQDRKTAGQEGEGSSLKSPIREEPISEHVDNAHASGLGAMGRNDEKLPTGADGADGPGPENPAY